MDGSLSHPRGPRASRAGVEVALVRLAPSPSLNLPGATMGYCRPTRFRRAKQLRGGPLDPVGYELCTPEGGKGGGARATRGFQVGETVMIGELEGEVERNDSHATQISRTKWARHRGLGPIVNHSCEPNCGVEVNETGACDFVP